MGFLDLFGNRDIVLDTSFLEQWPKRLIKQQRIDELLKKLLKEVEKRRRHIEEIRTNLSDVRIKKRFPERAIPLYDKHLPIVIKSINIIISKSDLINDVFLIEEQQEEFRKALQRYHQETEKSIASLKEFLKEELLTLNKQIRKLEDSILGLTPPLEERGLNNIKELKKIIEEYTNNREKEKRLFELKDKVLENIDRLERRKRKIKEKIEYYTKNARNPKFRELIAEEETLLKEKDEIKVKNLLEDEEDVLLKPITQRLAFLRKKMIADITSLNINEQRTFLDSVKDELLLERRKEERINDLLNELSLTFYQKKFLSLLEPFKVQIADSEEEKLEDGEEDKKD